MGKSLPQRHRPGSYWRTLAHVYLGRGETGAMIEDSSDNHGPSEFDELVIDRWFHLEQMDRRVWWVRVGDYDINVIVGPHGEAKSVQIERTTE